MTNPITFLAISDTVVDAFIELNPEHAHATTTENGKTLLSMELGDKLPFTEDYILYGVGNSANASVSLSRLGLKSHIATRLGGDENGQKSIESLKSNNVDCSHVRVFDGVQTNYHYVLWLKPERTILVKHETYSYDFPSEMNNYIIPDWVYLSSIGAGTEQYHDDIAQWMTEQPNSKLAFQPGTFQMKLGHERLAAIYQQTDLFFCNIQEAERILEVTPAEQTAEYVKGLMTHIMDLGPKVVVLTDGPNGAYSYDGTTYRFCPMYPDIAPPLERTGAGDAYASTFTAFYAQGHSIADCMMRAPINSMSVVQQVGAQAGLLTLEQLNDYVTKAPDSYTVVEI